LFTPLDSKHGGIHSFLGSREVIESELKVLISYLTG